MSHTALNHLLNSLSPKDFALLEPHLEAVDLNPGAVLYEFGEQIRYAYFPTTSIISLLYVLEDGASAETAVVGNEGVLGVTLFMGGTTTPTRAEVQSQGIAYRIKADILLQEFNKGEAIQNLLLRYTQVLITQMTQNAVCNRHHSVEQQVCRWLLRRLDRVSGNSLNITQESIANMLGVRREGVTEAAGRLQREGLIKYNRGHLEVLDRDSLEVRVCECYEVVKAEFERLLPDTDQRVSETLPPAYLRVVGSNRLSME